MSMKRRTFNKLLLGAVAGILAGTQAGSLYAGEAAKAAEAADEGGDKHVCKGMNECKGKAPSSRSRRSCAPHPDNVGAGPLACASP